MSQLEPPARVDQQLQEILKPILYTDIFDYPLTFEEIYKFMEVEASPAQVQSWLEQALEADILDWRNGFYSLPNRAHLAAKRRQRQALSRQLWPGAVYYGRWIASLPFVRLVAVTGALAVNNPRDRWDDIDYLVVTQARRLWLCRAMIILLVRYGHRRGVHLCPNYIITENVLSFDDNFFTARELLQMRPLYGQPFYLKIKKLNDWVARYFPHSKKLTPEQIDDRLSFWQSMVKQSGELLLSGLGGNLLEMALQKIQVTKHTRRAREYGALDKVIFTADVCKGHYDSHSHKTMTAYRQRMQEHHLEQEGAV